MLALRSKWTFTSFTARIFFKVCQWWQFSTSCAVSYSSQCLLFCKEHLKNISFMHSKPISSPVRYANQLTELTMALDSHNTGLKQALSLWKTCTSEQGSRRAWACSMIESLVASDFIAQKWKIPWVQCICFSKTDQCCDQIQSYHQMYILVCLVFCTQ